MKLTNKEAIETLLYRVKCPKGQHDVVRVVWDNDIVCQAVDTAVEALEAQDHKCKNCKHMERGKNCVRFYLPVLSHMSCECWEEK